MNDGVAFHEKNNMFFKFFKFIFNINALDLYIYIYK